MSERLRTQPQERDQRPARIRQIGKTAMRVVTWVGESFTSPETRVKRWEAHTAPACDYLDGKIKDIDTQIATAQKKGAPFDTIAAEAKRTEYKQAYFAAYVGADFKPLGEIVTEDIEGRRGNLADARQRVENSLIAYDLAQALDKEPFLTIGRDKVWNSEFDFSRQVEYVSDLHGLQERYDLPLTPVPEAMPPNIDLSRYDAIGPQEFVALFMPERKK